MQKPIQAAILGAAGSVGQRFVRLLTGHPWFEVVAVTGSERSVGQRYGDACHWVLPEEMPDWVKDMEISSSYTSAPDVPLVFSALPSHYAKEIEPKFAAGGTWVCSNASAFRSEADVPILLPEINPQHLVLIEEQKRNRGWKGGIVTNSNCTSTGIAVVLYVLDQHYGVDQVFAVSMQAISGAGYPGVAALDILDNVIPHIPGEEEKVELETRKILGEVENGSIVPANIQISAHTNRVAVSDGHTVCLSIGLRDAPADLSQVIAKLRAYQAPEASRELPSTPDPVIYYSEADDRPQPRLDRMYGKGMSTGVGRLRVDPILDLKLVVLSHNTIRGAAGGSIYNAELLVQEGYLS